MHIPSPETHARPSISSLRGSLPLRPLALTSPEHNPASSPPLTSYSPSAADGGPKSPNSVIPLTSPPFRPHSQSVTSPSAALEPLALPAAVSTTAAPAATSTTTTTTTAEETAAAVTEKPAMSVPADTLFSPALIPQDVAAKLPEGYVIRPLKRSDYAAGMLEVLKVLTTVGDISEAQWVERFDYMKKREGDYYLLVVEDAGKKIVGTGCVVAERKFIHNLGLVGHIEDIAVAKDQQGKKLGLYIIQTLDHIAKEVGCYKTILDCSEANEGFYLKCGFKRAGLEMSHYH